MKHSLPSERPTARAASRTIARDLEAWQILPLDHLLPARLSTPGRIWMIVLCGYAVVAAGLVVFRMFQLAMVEA